MPPTIPSAVFYPPRRRGLIFHGGLALILLSVGGLLFILALSQEYGAFFILFLVLSIACFAPLPFLIYRGYALLQARYILERDGLRLKWGLNSEDIPLPEIEWVRPAKDLGYPLPMPPLRTTGGILGSRSVKGLGPVDFFASEKDDILLVATPRRVYAISPSDPRAFMEAFQQVFELGSIAPLEAHTNRPALYIQSVWSSRLARALILAGTALLVILYLVVFALIPTHESIVLGFGSDGQPIAMGSPDRLLLLPVLCTFTYVADLVGGLFFFRRLETRKVAFVLWASSLVTPILAGAAAAAQAYWVV